MRDGLGLAEYRQRLIQFHGFYGPVEDLLFDRDLVDWPEHGLQPAERRKAAWLATDLAHFGVDDPAALPVCESLPTVDGTARAFGCLYVFEGATLGGRVISRHLLRTLGLDAGNGARFHSGYGELGPSRWESFRISLTRFAAGRDIDAAVVDGACDTFESLLQWCRLPVGTHD